MSTPEPAEIDNDLPDAMDYAFGLITHPDLTKVYVVAELDGKQVQVLCGRESIPSEPGNEAIIPLAIFMDAELDARLVYPEGMTELSGGEKKNDGTGNSD